MSGRPLSLLALLVLAGCGAPSHLDDPDAAPWLGAPGDGVRREASVVVDGAPVQLEIEDFDGTYVLEDDIVLDAADVQLAEDDGHTAEQGLAAVRPARLWPHGVVHYRFSAQLPQYMRERVKKAMAAWERRSVVRFEQAAPGRDDFVLIVPFDQPYCRATIGHTSGRSYIWLNEVCSVGLIKHELGHTLGLYHEQSRQDRAEHVQILWDNIKPWARGNFARYRVTAGRDVGPYNVDSIMQYSSHAFSRNGRPTIVRRDNGKPFGGWRSRIHELDAAGIDRIYADEVAR